MNEHTPLSLKTAVTSTETAVESAIGIGDQVEMRKPHPCGGVLWTVYRVGADMGLRCLTCDRRILMTRSAFNKDKRRLIKTTHTENEVGP